VEFQTPLAGSGFADLPHLKDMVGDARVVALGEATHGTREFFQMKHRLLEYLVEEMDFTTFAIEASFPEALLLNEYVKTGVGEPSELIIGMHFWTWSTEEVLEMVQWMRSYNEEHGGTQPVSFFGFDNQYPLSAIGWVQAYVYSIDQEAYSYVDSLYSLFGEQMSQNVAGYKNEPDSVKVLCRQQVQQVYDFLEQHRTEYETASSIYDYSVALRCARIVIQHEDMRDGRYWMRDEYMAENAAWILNHEGPGAKIVLWAHNGHVKTRSHYDMGWHLRNTYGPDLLVVGFNFYEGYCTARGWDPISSSSTAVQTHLVTPPPPDAYASLFKSTGFSRLMIDLRDLDYSTDESQWIVGPRRFRSIGAVYDVSRPQDYFTFSHLPEEFDLIIYFEQTTNSILLPFSMDLASDQPNSRIKHRGGG